MRLITRNTDYAVRALVCLARRKGEVVAVPQLAAAEGIPRPFLRRIMQVLCRNGMVASCQGKSGGFRLERDPEDISLAEVALAFQGELEVGRCLFRKRICRNHRTCFLRKEMKKIEKVVISELERVKIASLLMER